MKAKDPALTHPATPDGMTEPSPPVPLAFAIVVFAVAIVVAVIIAYFGLRGQLGAGVP